MQNGMPSLDTLEHLTEPKVENNDPKAPYTTEKGVTLRLLKISTDVIRRAWTAIPIPQPPQVWIEDHGRYEPNPADPGYNSELSLYNNKVTGCIHQIIMMRAVEIIPPVPSEIPPPESDEWTEGLDDFFEMPKGRLARKAMWLLDYILDDTERDLVINRIMRTSGMVVQEAQVAEVTESFRSDGEPEADRQVQDTPGSTD